MSEVLHEFIPQLDVTIDETSGILQGFQLTSDILGEGRFGRVVDGINSLDPNSHIAIKIINKQLIQTPQDLLRINNEFKALTLLQSEHAYVVRLLGICQSNHFYCVFMEKIPLPLTKFLQRFEERISLETTLLVIKSLFETVSFCHNRNISHNDLRPSKCLVRINPRYLSELETTNPSKSAKFVRMESHRAKNLKAIREQDSIREFTINETTSHSRRSLTRSKSETKEDNLQIVFFGFGDSESIENHTIEPLTPALVNSRKGYFPPERMLEGTFDRRKGDIWGVGCILLNILMGEKRFQSHWVNGPYRKLTGALNDASSYRNHFSRFIDIFQRDYKTQLQATYRHLEPSILNDLTHLIRSTLVLDPSARAPLDVLCQHAIFQKSYEEVKELPAMIGIINSLIPISEHIESPNRFDSLTSSGSTKSASDTSQAQNSNSSNSSSKGLTPIRPSSSGGDNTPLNRIRSYFSRK